MSNLSGGWCKHGVMEANRCDACIEELRAAGIDITWHEGDPEQFKKALNEMLIAQTSDELPAECERCKEFAKEVEQINSSICTIESDKPIWLQLRWMCGDYEKTISELRDQLTGANEELAKREGEIARLSKDAERYRWLRHGDNDEEALKTYTHSFGPQQYMPRNDALDSLIDAAIAAQAQSQGSEEINRE